ncbi:pex11 domain protein [Diplodia corticola]|uniref:Pex11 domain protein n=1 Tax=Diplodia corticola TaxID=236234 RepID=A0A1J9QV55_9PEZI|nr:pex11 domain protein [Diplodia corticola]OJD31858.1 pex11 domain protein [Diplodia corticola]
MSLLHFTRFMNDAAALEKTLRLLQGITQLNISLLAAGQTAEAAQVVHVSSTLRTNFALARRYFRLFKWIDSALVAADALRNNEALVDSEREGVLAFLNISKWSYLGMFLLTEAITILDASGVKKSSWAPLFFVESQRFWFYSISCSLILTCYNLYTNRNEIICLQAGLHVAKATAENGISTSTNGDAKPKDQTVEKLKPLPKKDHVEEKERALEKARKQRSTHLRQLVGGSCDLLTPGAVIKWIPVSPAVVAITSIISSFISQQDIWRKLNTD